MKTGLNRLIMLSLLAALLVPAVNAQQRIRGIEGRPAPAWDVSHWENLSEGKSSLDIADFAGKVVYLFGFQSWCPGCHSHGFPTLRAVRGTFEDQDEVAFVAVQTVFEGFGVNTAEKAKESCDKFGLDIPCGHDPGSDGKGSTIMRRYRSGGTPWTVIIDRNGIVRFNGFSIKPDVAVSLIGQLLAEKSSESIRQN